MPDRAPHSATDAPWEVQRFDSAWGGFRAIPDSQDNPTRYQDKADAIAATLRIASALPAHHQFRVYHRVSGNIVGFLRRDSELVPL
jgi:hypothetical protein